MSEILSKIFPRLKNVFDAATRAKATLKSSPWNYYSAPEVRHAILVENQGKAWERLLRRHQQLMLASVK
ncbi:MAG: hypothetical protein H6822_22840 [Planctomycetaceae bacterium]|nr:hypothetical protein [Planctomycetales bacterium]MCB9925033.1 hypothetical protein [Planctomycetaceae bacterium]